MHPHADLPTRSARTPEDLAAAVRDALDSGRPLVDYGIAHIGLGHPAPDDATRLERTGAVIAFYQRDLTVTVAAGCTVGELSAALAEAGQFLPLDADDDLSVAEVIDHNVYGPLRVGYGSIRDLLLGASFVDGRGELNTVGGRTVKNVAGYDVTRLLIGALGELGALATATFRTYATPAATVAADVALDDPQRLDELMTDLLTAEAAPAHLSVLRQGGGFIARLGYHGEASACLTQAQSLRALVEREPTMSLTAIDERGFDDDQTHRAARRAWRRSAEALVKVVVPPATTGFICKTLAETPAGDPDRALEALPAHGCVYVGGPLDADHARRLDQQIEHVTQPHGGYRVWHRQPPGAGLDPVAPRPSDFDVLRRIKAAMDPHGLLNPGRYLPPPQDPAS